MVPVAAIAQRQESQSIRFTLSENYTICGGGSYNWHGFNYTAAGTYTADYTSSKGCDSTYTLILAVEPVYAFTENYAICVGDSYSWRGNTYSTPGTYNASYVTAHGCDSIYTLYLTFKPTYNFTENHSICQGDSYTWQGYAYSSSGTYSINYYTNKGCDSTYTMNLTVNPVYAFAENQNICKGDIYNWQGSNYVIGGVYTAAYHTIYNCDSTYTLNLSVSLVDTSMSLVGDSLTANATADAYQWLDCDNSYAAIPGEIYQSYTPLSNGNYAVMVTQGLCSDTSGCIQITTVGIESSASANLSIYPNPVKDQLVLSFVGNNSLVQFEVFDALGQQVAKGSFTEKANIGTSHLATGVYIIKFTTGRFVDFRKFIKQ
jgi:hypothetical protein